MLKQSTRQQSPQPANAYRHALTALAILTAFLAGGCSTTPDNTRPVVIAKPSTETVTLHQQAVALMEQEKWQQAVQALEHITRTQENLSVAWLNLGIAYTKTGNSEAAESAFNKAIEANPGNAEAYNQTGILYRRSGRTAEAGDMYENGLKVSPDNPDIHWNLGILHDRYLHDPQKALFHYHRYQQLTGDENVQLQAWINTLEKSMPEDQLTAKVTP